MQKCVVSKYYIRIYVAGFCCGVVPMFAVSLQFLSAGVDTWDNIILTIVLTGLLAGLLFLDFPTGTFSINQDGIAMRVGFMKRSRTWEEIVECGLISNSICGSKSIPIVYFSTRHLTNEERSAFLRKTRRDLAHIAFFECNAKFLQKAYPLMPTEYALYLRNRVRQIGISSENAD